MGFSEDMFALLKSKDWKACLRRIDEEAPGETREKRVSIAHWRAAIFKWEKRYDEALLTLDASKADVFTQCGFLYERAVIRCRMGKFAEAIATLRYAPFGAEIDAFPGLTYEAMFLYCYLLIKSGHETPPNLLAAIPDDFRTLTYEGKFMSKADLLSSGRDSATPRI